MKRERKHDLDWLRVIAIILLLFFHTGMIFISWTWYFMQDTHTSVFFDEFTMFLSNWRMALLFLISGTGTLFALGFRSGRQYLKERILRLLVPLIFGILIIIPPQIYYELLNHGRVFSNYLDFNYQYLKGGLYPLGDFSWHHLWFIGYLFLYSCLALPLFLFLRSEKGKPVISRIADFLEKKGAIYLLIVPLFIVQILLRDKFSGFHNLIDDMANFTLFFLFFVYGFIICSDERLWTAIEKQRRMSLSLALVFYLLSYFERLYFGGVLGYYGYWIIQTGVSWFWVISIIGYGRRYLNFKTKFLRYANEGIYPFYILHQTVLIILAFYIIRWDTSIYFKYIVLSLSTLLICVAVYDFVIKRNNYIRVLFGMRLNNKT